MRTFHLSSLLSARAAGLGAAVGLLAVGAPAAAAAGLEQSVVLTQIPSEGWRAPSAEQGAGVFRGDWFERARVVRVTTERRVVVLSQGFYSACDPEVSFDARHVVFAGRREAQSPWALWETDPDGRQVRQITSEPFDCRSPVFLGSLFTLDAPEPWLTLAFVRQEPGLNELGTARASSLCSVKLDGGDLRRLTFSPGVVADPVQLGDGRLVYSGERSAAAGSRLSLFNVHIDGMDGALYTGGPESGSRQMACAAGGRVVFVESAAGAWDGAGQLASVRETRPFHSYQTITTDPQWLWLHPAPIGTNRILVSRRAAAPSSDCALFTVDLETGRAEPFFHTPGHHEIQAKVLAPRPLPDGRSSVADPKYQTGVLYGLSQLSADPGLAALSQTGGVARLRVVAGVPGTAAAPSFGQRVLGEAPVEKDGSFHIEAPAATPLKLQALDSNGVVRASCRWIWVKPKENLGCVGCHEDPELMPENAFPAALARPATLLAPAQSRPAAASGPERHPGM